jgi:uncharacterized RDD family membrane protein YckC
MTYAGFWVRTLAFLIDLLIWNILGLIPQYLLTWMFGLSAFNEQILGEVLSLFILFGYYVWYQSKTGTTPGKRIFSIYVIDEKTGLYPSKKQCLGRLFGYLISAVILGCGFLMAAFHPQKKTMHDLISGTACVRRKKAV